MDTLLATRLEQKVEMIEAILKQKLRGITREEIKTRFRQICKIDEPRLDQYYLDDELILEIELIISFPNPRWEIRVKWAAFVNNVAKNTKWI